MKKRWIITIVSITTLLLAGVSFGIAYGISSIRQSTIEVPTHVALTKYEVGPPDAQEMLELVNNEREKVGVSPLVRLTMLDQSAQWKSDDEVVNGYFGHTKPGTLGNNGLDYLNSIDVNGTCSHVSENIRENVTDNNTSKSAVDAWIYSEAHYKAMIDPRYSFTGFGINGLQVVQHFCQQS